MAKCKNCKCLELNNLTGKKRCFLLGEVKEIESIRFCGAYRPMTNADRIRSMTDEELAKILFKECTGVMGFDGCPHGISNISCEECVLDWLKSEVKQEENIPSISLEDLNLSTRAYNGLKRARINTIEDLCNRTPDDIIRIRDLGRKSLDEIIEKMAQHGLKFKSEVGCE